MFAWQDVTIEQGHDVEKARTVQPELEGKAGRPRFLMQGLAWVEFQYVALKRQQHELLGASIENVCGPLAENGGSLLL
jgi:hypothetical protein